MREQGTTGSTSRSDVLPEATPTHGFHVFGVYPWSRLLGLDSPEPLRVLDSCRIGWGQVVAVDAEHVVVTVRRLRWDGERLSLGVQTRQRVRFSTGGRAVRARPFAGGVARAALGLGL